MVLCPKEDQMPGHIPFPDIQQFRNTIKLVRERAEYNGYKLEV
jgi:hypothetical protein